MADIPLETLRNIYYSKVRDPKVSTVYQLSRVLGVSVNALLGDCEFENEEKELIRLYRESGRHGKNLIRLVARYEHSAAARERSTEGVRRIPCLVPTCSMKDGTLAGENMVTEVVTDNQDAYLAVELNNNNFIPIFFKGDRILLENRFPENGERAFFEIDDRLYFRQYVEADEIIKLKSLSRKERDIIAARADDVMCIGTCVGVIHS